MHAPAPGEPATAHGRRAMVVSGHPLATQAAVEALEEGGSHADAGVAAAAVLAVVLPQACSIGGDAFIHVWSGRHVETVNASGLSPALATPDNFADGIPARGAKSVSVPGVLEGWWTLHERYGRLPWARLLAPAIGHAKDGFAVWEKFARAIAANAELLGTDPGCRSFFMPRGAPLEPGATVRQPRLAQVLEAIACEGPRVFYDGEIAGAIDAFMQSSGGLLRAGDMRGYKADWVEPLIAHYAGHQVHLVPPNSYGLYMSLQLTALEDVGLASVPLVSVERFACLIAAARAAFAAGRPLVADPGHVPDWRSKLADPQLRAAVKARMAETTIGLPPNRGGTAMVSVVDADGQACCIMQSVFQVFGSACYDPDTGILFHDRMMGFTADPESPNVVAPKKRPAHTLNPMMVTRNGRLRYVMASPGGPGQTITMTQILTALLDHGARPDEAVATPRWSTDFAGEVLLEPNISQAMIDGLARLGIAAAHGAAASPFFGSVEMIECGDDGLFGVADWRREASVTGM